MGPAPTDERRDRYRRVPGRHDGARARSCASRRAATDGSRCRRTACRCSTTGATHGEWTYDDGGYEKVDRAATATSRSTSPAACASASSARAPTGARRSRKASRRGSRSRGTATRRRRSRRRRRSATPPRSTGATGSRWRSSTTTCGARTSSAARSALKSLSYAPTGAIMAAGTTSLPETPGGERNWDYRYTWIRDTAFMLRALHDLGFDWEAFEYFAFMLETLAAGDGAGRSPTLQIMYGIGGETDLTEHTLDHLSGYRNSRPVRIGNGAFDQHQHDVWGMLLDAVDSFQRRGGQMPPHVWDGICRLVDQAIERFPEPDQGIWEMRGEPQHFVASKVMCWVAVDRGTAPRRVRGDTERVERWQAAADEMHAEILDAGHRRPRRVHAVLRHQGPRRVEPAHPDHGLPPRRRRTGARHRARHRRRAHQGRARAALPGRHAPTTGSPARRARSRSAPSGWCRRSRSSARPTGPARCSRSCSRSPARCTSTPRRSTPRPASTSATSRRRSRTSRSIDAGRRLIAVEQGT